MKTVIEMAREVGIEFTCDPTETPPRAFVECWIEELERFAELVRADEREACAKLCDKQADSAYWEGADACADAIRARSST